MNNVAAAHLEGFGSIEGVARAKGEIYRGLTPNGVAIINSEHNYIELWQKKLALIPFNILMVAITKLKM